MTMPNPCTCQAGNASNGLFGNHYHCRECNCVTNQYDPELDLCKNCHKGSMEYLTLILPIRYDPQKTNLQDVLSQVNGSLRGLQPGEVECAEAYPDKPMDWKAVEQVRCALESALMFFGAQDAQKRAVRSMGLRALALMEFTLAENPHELEPERKRQRARNLIDQAKAMQEGR